MQSRTSDTGTLKTLAMAVLLLLVGSTASSQAPSIDWTLDEAIKQIERQAKDFETGMARVESVFESADGSENRTSVGTGFIRKDGRMRYTEDGSGRTTWLEKNSVTVYDAAANTVAEYSLRKHKDRLEPFIRLGFTTTGKDMKDDFLLTLVGAEDVGDARTVVIELVPEKESVRQVVRSIRLNIDQASWMPVRQIFEATADGGTWTLTYTGMARNLKLNPDLFKKEWPRGTEKIKT